MVLGERRSARISVLIVHHVRLYREGLAAALAPYENLAIRTAGSRAEALDAVANGAIHVIVVDVALPDSLDAMRELRAQAPAARIVAFDVDEDVSAVLECAEAGAAGFVTAGATADDLVDAMERALAGELRCSPRMAAELLRRAAERTDGAAPEPPSPGLTGREQQVLLCVQQGLSNKEIAARLNIAEATVKNHVHHLLEKLHVPTRSLAAAQSKPQGRRVGVRVPQPSGHGG